MTPARRAALKKAQKASARKRRRKAIAITAAKGAGGILGAFAAARVSTYIVRPSRIFKDYNSVKAFLKDGPSSVK